MEPDGSSSTNGSKTSVSVSNGQFSVRPFNTRPSRRRLTGEQELLVQRYLRTTPASAADGASKLWNASKVHRLVYLLTGIDLPDRTFRTYLERWDLVPPRPLQQAYRSGPVAVKLWMSLDHPVIASQARQAGAKLLWLDVYRMDPLVKDGNEHDASDHMVFLTDNRGHSEWIVSMGYPGPDQVCWVIEQALGNNGGQLHVLVRERQLIESPTIDEYFRTHAGQLLLIPLRFGE